MKIFKNLSEIFEVDIDKVIFDNDEDEKKKLEKALKKETFKERTRLIEEDN